MVIDRGGGGEGFAGVLEENDEDSCGDGGEKHDADTYHMVAFEGGFFSTEGDGAHTDEGNSNSNDGGSMEWVFEDDTVDECDHEGPCIEGDDGVTDCGQ